MRKLNLSSLSVSGILTTIFLGLKVGGILSWSWLWVLSPLWIDLGLSFIVWTILYCVMRHDVTKGAKK